MDLVSIIVPVHNAEKFLNKCVDSILNQSYKKIEVILINDGSTDNSGEICEYYSKKDDRVKVLHQRNLGPSVARNNGIHKASGKYIQLVDSDDYIDRDMTEVLVNEVKKNVDLVLCGYRYLYKSDNNETIIKNSNIYEKTYITKHEFLNRFGILFKDYYINYICNKLYHRDIIIKHNIKFDSSLAWGEDLLFNINYLNHCNIISIVDKLLYNYNKYNENSITASFNKDLYSNQQKMYTYVRKFLKENNSYSGENKRIVEEKFANSIIRCLQELFHPDANYKKEEIKIEINNIIENDEVILNLFYFKNIGLQGKVIAKAIEFKFISFIIGYFKSKNYIRKKTKYLYKILKKINSYSKLNIN